MYLWRAVDDEGEFLDLVMQRERDTAAASKLLRRLLRNQAIEPTAIVTDGLTSYGAAPSTRNPTWFAATPTANDGARRKPSGVRLPQHRFRRDWSVRPLSHHWET